jgi:hypothetical protein
MASEKSPPKVIAQCGKCLRDRQNPFMFGAQITADLLPWQKKSLAMLCSPCFSSTLVVEKPGAGKTRVIARIAHGIFMLGLYYELPVVRVFVVLNDRETSVKNFREEWSLVDGIGSKDTKSPVRMLHTFRENLLRHNNGTLPSGVFILTLSEYVAKTQDGRAITAELVRSNGAVALLIDEVQSAAAAQSRHIIVDTQTRSCHCAPLRFGFTATPSDTGWNELSIAPSSDNPRPYYVGPQLSFQTDTEWQQQLSDGMKLSVIYYTQHREQKKFDALYKMLQLFIQTERASKEFVGCVFVYFKHPAVAQTVFDYVLKNYAASPQLIVGQINSSDNERSAIIDYMRDKNEKPPTPTSTRILLTTSGNLRRAINVTCLRFVVDFEPNKVSKNTEIQIIGRLCRGNQFANVKFFAFVDTSDKLSRASLNDSVTDYYDRTEYDSVEIDKVHEKVLGTLLK